MLASPSSSHQPLQIYLGSQVAIYLSVQNCLQICHAEVQISFATAAVSFTESVDNSMVF